MRSSLPEWTRSLLRAGLAIFAAGCVGATAQETRTWTDTKGRTLEGAFLKQDEINVWIRRGDGKEVAIPKKTLSEDDLKHLTDAVPASVAKPASAGAGERFATAKIDPSAWHPREGGFKLGTLSYPGSLETEHFIIAGNEKTRPAMFAAYADAAERLWTDIATDYPGLAEAFKGRKMAILLLDGDREIAALASWHQKHAQESSSISHNYGMETNTIGAIPLDPKFAEDAGLTPNARFFRMDAKKAEHTRKTWPQRVHFLAEDLVFQLTGKIKNNGEYGFSILRLAFSYHREETVCGRIESEVTFGSGGADVEGFKNGRNWAGATKKILKGGGRPDITEYLKINAAKAQPRDLGFGLALMDLIHRDPARLSGFGKLMSDAAAAGKAPDPEAFVKALGMASPEALNRAWLDFMLSDAFQ